MNALYVIASNGHAVINGLGQIKAWEDFDDAVIAGGEMIANGQNLGDFRVQEIQVIGKGKA